jgi:pyruvate dehydrogenase E2 component (dihydrolipoamide acetyltransferase)
MPVSIVMPALEMGQETGTLVSWRKKDGEQIKKGEPLLEVETDKAVLEVEATADGVLAGIRAQEGDVIPVGQTIAWILTAGERLPDDFHLFQKKSAPASSTSMVSANSAIPPANNAPLAGRISPKARRLAKEHGLDISKLQGSGAEGEILTSDIERLVNKKGTPTAEASGNASTAASPPSTVSRLMAERTTQSWTTIPHFFLTREIDASTLTEARKKLGAEIESTRGVKLTHTDLLVALVARALAKHPRMNASWSQGVHLNQDVNVAIAMAVDDGVVTATIRNTDKARLSDISIQRRDLSERATAGKLRPPDIAGATFTVSNLGMYKIDAFTAIIIPPQAGILAVGQIADRIVAIEGKLAVRAMITLTLSCDHRIVDGAQGALFLNDVAEAIRQPEEWLR